MAKLKKGIAVPGKSVYTRLSPTDPYLTEAYRKRYGDDAYFGTLFNYELSQESANKQMAFQDYMSSTAHQREVKDLQAAGLNPILAANGGAATGSGASITSDSTPTSAVAQKRMLDQQIKSNQLLAKLDRKNQLKIANNNIKSQQLMNKYSVDKSYELGLHQTELGYAASIYGANQSAAAQRYAAGANAAAMMYSANQSAAAQMYYADQALAGTKYSSDNSLEGTKYTADKQRISAKELNRINAYLGLKGLKLTRKGQLMTLSGQLIGTGTNAMTSIFNSLLNFGGNYLF